MCSSVNALGYGLFVRTASLVSAVDTYHALKGPLAFFKLFSLRRRKNVLEFDPFLTFALPCVPGEVWEMIRLQVIASEVEQAQEALLSDIFLGASHAEPYEPHDTFVERWNKAVEAACPACGGGAFINWEFVFNEQRIKRAGKLLRSYGLQLPSRLMLTPRNHNPDERWKRDNFHSASFVCLNQSRLYYNTAQRSIGGDAGFDDYQDGDALVDLSFDLPSDADRRFKRFLRDYQIEVVNVKVDQVGESGVLRPADKRDLPSAQPEEYGSRKKREGETASHEEDGNVFKVRDQ
ncbi:hypothetical protein JCM11251_004106 [Rhodosporidiobolus azoricus]